MKYTHLPQKQGLYDPRFEHDNCGVGFICHIKGHKTNTVVRNGLDALCRLSHRGATGADPKTGDGAGILIQMPHEFFVKVSAQAKISLPAGGSYGSGLVFLPTGAAERKLCKDTFASVVEHEGTLLLGWRKVPVDDADIGRTARQTEPVIEQVFIGAKKTGGAGWDGGLAFERQLYVIRKRVENIVRAADLKQRTAFYIASLSCRTFSYKGLLMPDQVEKFFVDLRDPAVASAICLVHSRYSTNTFPTWDRAQPFRYLAHNGEINTLRGNINWMRAREGLLASSLFGDKLKDLKPVLVPGGSDSAAIDNMLELLYLAGRPIAHAMMMLIPPAWERAKHISARVKSFYTYHACLSEPWDGPAAIAFTDGVSVGALLDRNGLRPCRYILTKDDMVMMASEVGVLKIPAERIQHSGRLEPGKMFFINTAEGRIVHDEEIKEAFARKQPYGQWVRDSMLKLHDIPVPPSRQHKEADIRLQLRAFGYTREDLKVIIKPMAETGQEPVGSMGNDTPHAVLSTRPQPLYHYFKQLFAQVTNPPVDPIREEIIMNLNTYLGPEKNILEETRAHAHKLFVESPVLTDEELEKIRGIRGNGFKTRTISLLFDPRKRGAFVKRLDAVCKEVQSAIEDGFTFVVLSDRGVDAMNAAIPALMAVGAVHHYLVKKATRARLSIILESAEPREVHHFAVLFGYGVDCVNPYLALASLRNMIADGELKNDYRALEHNYIKAVDKGILKILSKMGISTLQSYRGAQIFEALGLADDVIERAFCGTVSRIGGATLAVIEEETLRRHKQAFVSYGFPSVALESGGQYQWKRDGEFHLWNPESITALQEAVRREDYGKFKEFSKLIDDQSAHPVTLRGMLDIKGSAKPIPLAEVEPAAAILKRFATGAMSFGSISGMAHKTIAIAMNRLGGRSNTGEGGEDPARFKPLANGDSLRSAIKQVASGRFGVTTNYLINADELQIKIAQGAKPGEGGQLPGHKVSAIIAKTRYTTPGVTLISPPPHHDIYSIEDLAQLIYDLKNVNPAARISVKLVSEAGVGTVAAGVAKGHADMILISGFDGGTGASPWSSIKHAGLPWELGLSEAHQTLVLNDLRSRVRLQTDGQMRTGRDVAIAALLGAEEYGFCSAVLVTLGCVMLRHCNLNNCSVGVATQDELLEKRFCGRPEYVMNYFRFVVEELREIMAKLGISTVDGLIGRTDLLEVNKGGLPWKARGLDLSGILYRPEVTKETGTYRTVSQDHNIENVLDRKLIALAVPSLSERKDVKIDMPIENVDRTVGAMLSGEVCKRFGEDGLPADTVRCRFTGYAGQSFGAFLASGITFELEGMANDYVGKGISGGKIAIYPDRKATYAPQDNMIVGNTAFYGAIAGQAYISGRAGERFCIRNSGLYAVVEGVGDHGCEYMTGGRVVVIGTTGRNFAAGMSGGIAYVYDPDGALRDNCNPEMVTLEKLEDGDIEAVRIMLHDHIQYTHSPAAVALMDDFHAAVKCFVKVMPMEYKRVLEEMGLSGKKNTDQSSDG